MSIPKANDHKKRRKAEAEAEAQSPLAAAAAQATSLKDVFDRGDTADDGPVRLNTVLDKDLFERMRFCSFVTGMTYRAIVEEALNVSLTAWEEARKKS